MFRYLIFLWRRKARVNNAIFTVFAGVGCTLFLTKMNVAVVSAV